MKRSLLWKIEEVVMKGLMVGAMAIVVGCLLLILGTVLWKGLPAMNLAMLVQAPQGGYYTGAEGGILNAILGSLYLSVGATLVSFFLGLPIALYLQAYAGHSRVLESVRLSLDVLWGIPSIVYGAFGLSVMLFLGMRASLLGGIIALSLVELPIMCRAGRSPHSHWPSSSSWRPPSRRYNSEPMPRHWCSRLSCSSSVSSPAWRRKSYPGTS
jgi:phosphate transport system permease protein